MQPTDSQTQKIVVLSDETVARALTELGSLRERLIIAESLLREGVAVPQCMPSDELLVWSRRAREALGIQS
jgi:hypothetical protein